MPRSMPETIGYLVLAYVAIEIVGMMLIMLVWFCELWKNRK